MIKLKRAYEKQSRADGERIRIASFSFRLAGEPEVKRRLTDEVERDVGERDVLFEDWSVPAPLGKAVAEYEAIVAYSEEIFEQVVVADSGN